MSEGTRQTTIERAGIRLDLATRMVTVNGRVHHLTPMACRLLWVLMKRAGETLGHGFLMRTVWGTDDASDLNTLRAHVCMVRRVIEDDPAWPQRILTRRAEVGNSDGGYRFTGGDTDT